MAKRPFAGLRQHAWDRKMGLVLPGGGARGAYQVGVLKALAQMLPRRAPNPFPVVSGTSAGSINAVVLASRAKLFRVAVAEMDRVWTNFRCEQVYRSDAWTMLKTSTHWLTAMAMGGLGAANPRSLLNNQPLRKLLHNYVNFGGIQKSIDRGYVDAVAVTAAGYGSARSVTFYQGSSKQQPWERVRRIGKRQEITLDHLMASIAVPMIFPPVRIGDEYFGDGAMRQATPLSPAVHLGADRILVIGARNEVPDPAPAPGATIPYPNLGSIAGYVLDALFMDGLSSDLERLTRINLTLDKVPGGKIIGDAGTLRFIDVFVMLPSQDIREIASRHFHEMPRPVRLLMHGLGALNHGGRQLISYLLFESGYTSELIKLGYEDGLAREEELRAFMEGAPIEQPGGIAGWKDLSEEYTGRFQLEELG